MDSYMMPRAVPVNGNPHLAGLPLFDWQPAPPAHSLLDIRAERLARRLRQPVTLVKVHMLAAGLGEVR